MFSNDKKIILQQLLFYLLELLKRMQFTLTENTSRNTKENFN